MTRQETINSAVTWAIATAEDPAHGYDQTHRWGPDYDCSSFVIEAWEQAGVPVKSKGAVYTGNMYLAFLRCGFRDVTKWVNLANGAGLENGDVLLNPASHTEMYVGGGLVVKASLNEHGGITGGQAGDQTGREVYVGNYYNAPWDCVLRYDPQEEEKPDDPETPEEPVTVSGLPTLRRGDKGLTVLAMQAVLQARGFALPLYGNDGDFGGETEAALIAFQTHCKIEADGLCGPVTWAYLLGVRT